VRRAAARSQCANNLKQLGLGVHSHVDAQGHVPAGSAGDSSLPPDDRMSFYVSLLPYIECGESMAVRQQTTRAGAAAVVEGQPEFRVFRCADWVREARPESPHTTAYVGPAGIGPDAATRAVRNPGVGMWGYDRRTKWEDVKDGLGDTALLVESGRQNGHWYQGGPATVRGLDTGEAPYLGAGNQFAGTHFSENWIVVRGKAVGMNVVLGDGSTRFMRNTVDPGILEALFTIAGGESMEKDW
jgi:Protein of unknown function (DUF1559)